MHITIAPGDSLWILAERWLGSGMLWPLIARHNRIDDPDLLLIGQVIEIDPAWSATGRQYAPSSNGPAVSSRGLSDFSGHARPTREPLTPAASYVFVLADEVNVFSRKVVRRVLVHPQMAADASLQLGRPLSVFPDPQRYGLTATNPQALLPPGRHAMGMKPSPFLSASTRLFGATRFVGTPFWIDVALAKAQGATLHETSEILADLDRIAAKLGPAHEARIAHIQALVKADAEVLVKGHIPGSAIKGPLAMGMTRALQGVQVVGFACSAVNLAQAAQESVATSSARPLAAETVRQAGGWAAAWAGVKLGASAGAMVGLTTGPGAVISGAVGGIAGGIAGYFAFDWVADHIHAN